MRALAVAALIFAACGGDDTFRHELFTISSGEIACQQGGDFEPATAAGFDFVCCFPEGAAHSTYRCDRAWAFFRRADPVVGGAPNANHGVVDGWEYAVFYDGCH